jgi:hypothetical protein
MLSARLGALLEKTGAAMLPLRPTVTLDARVPDTRGVFGASSVLDLVALDLPAGRDQPYWSSTPLLGGNPSRQWIVDFNTGKVTYDLPTSMYYVRCVR